MVDVGRQMAVCLPSRSSFSRREGTQISGSTMAGPKRLLRFLWWNLQSFAHYDKARAGEIQWPLVPEEYAAKCARIDQALRELSVPSPPEVMAFGEVTRTAAENLRDRLFPDCQVLSLDQLPRSEFQV